MINKIETYSEIRKRAKGNATKFWLLFTVSVIFVAGAIFRINKQNIIIDRFNNSVVFKTTEYSLHVSECGKRKDHALYGITFTGTHATVGRTVAVDPDYIPLGSHIFIMQGIEIQGKRYFEFIAEDTGSGVKGKTIDIYVGDETQHYVAEQYGIKYLSIYIQGDK